MERIAHIGATAYELPACRFQIRHDEIQILDRARRCGRDSLAEMDGARRAGRCHLDGPPIRTVGEFAVESPSKALIEALGTVDVGYRKDDDLELQIDCRRRRNKSGKFVDRLCAAHL